MYLSDLIEICDDFDKCDNPLMIDLAIKAIALNYYHYQRQSKMFADMSVINGNDIDNTIQEIQFQDEIHFIRERGQLYYKSCSPACNYCVEDSGYTARISTFCNRECFFCFVSDTPLTDANVVDISKYQRAFMEKNSISPIKSFAISGGEPLINPKETIALFKWVREKFSHNIYCRLYTNGDYLNEDILSELKKVALDEIRLSIKPGEHPSKNKIDIIKKYIPQLVIEMPVIPGDEDNLYELYDELEKTNIDGINLVELFFNGNKKDEFNKRGLKIAMPNGIRSFGCAEFPYEYPIIGSYKIATESLKYIAQNKYHYFAYICCQDTKMAQYYSSNKKQIDSRLDSIFNGSVDENGNIIVIAVFGEKDEILQIIDSNPHYTYDENVFFMSMSIDKRLSYDCDSCYLTLNKSLQPVWIKIRSIASHGKCSKMREIKKEIIEYGNNSGFLLQEMLQSC